MQSHLVKSTDYSERPKYLRYIIAITAVYYRYHYDNLAFFEIAGHTYNILLKPRRDEENNVNIDAIDDAEDTTSFAWNTLL